MDGQDERMPPQTLQREIVPVENAFEGLFGRRVFRRKNEGHENGGKEAEETVWNEGNERTLSSGSL